MLAMLSPRILHADAPNSWLHEGLLITGSWGAGGRGGAAAGVSQMLVVAVDGDKVVAVTQAFNDQRVIGIADPVPMIGTGVLMGTLDQCGDYWISPAKLAALPNDPANGSTVTQTTWKIPTGNVPAVEWTVQTTKSIETHVFDAKTGLCYHFSTNSKSAAANGDFLGMRDMNVPWAHEAPPPWVANLKALHYQGQMVMRAMPQVIPTRLKVDATVADRGKGWVLFNLSTITQVGNSPPIPQNDQIVSGQYQIGGIWAGPAALAALKKGQVLDEDPITHVKTIVSNVTGDTVAITRANGAGQWDFQYDKQSGILKVSSFIEATLKQQTMLQLQSRE